MSLVKEPFVASVTLEPAARLRLERVVEGNATVIVLVGEVEMTTASALRSALEGAASSTRQVVMDMADVTFLDSSGLATILEAQRTLRNDFCELAIRNPSPVARRVLEISGVATRVPTT